MVCGNKICTNTAGLLNKFNVCCRPISALNREKAARVVWACPSEGKRQDTLEELSASLTSQERKRGELGPRD